MYADNTDCETKVLGVGKSHRLFGKMAQRTAVYIRRMGVRRQLSETDSIMGRFYAPVKTAIKKPDGMKKFSALKSCEIALEYYGIYDRRTRRAITPDGFAEAFYKANK